MKKRSTEILQKFVKGHANQYSMTKLAQEYHVTQRTLRNDVADINNFLYDIHVPELMYEDGYLKLPENFNTDIVQQELYEMDMYMYKLSPEERRIYIVISLIQQDGYLVMQKLADELYVNRITILNDLEDVNEYLESMAVEMVSDVGKGIFLRCGQEKKIELLTEMFRKISVNIENEGFFQRLMLKKIKIQYPFSKIFSYLAEYTAANNLVFIDDVFYEIVLYLFAVFNLREKPLEVPILPSDIVLKDLDYLIVYIGQRLEEKVTREDLNRFRQFLSEHELSSFVKTIDEVELYKVISYFLSEIDKKLMLNLHSDNMLIDSLLMHIKRMKDWGNFEIEFPNEYDSCIDYEKLNEVINENSSILERFLSYELSDNMKKSIVIHICVALIRNHRYTSRLAVAVVCPGSMATGKYLEAQIKNYFDFKIIGVYSASQVLERLKWEKRPVDLILSTVSLYTDEYRVLKVNPFLTMEDMNKIQQISFRCQKAAKNETDGSEQGFVYTLKKLMQEQKISRHLERDLENLILDYERRSKAGRNSAISELLRREYIVAEENVYDWKTAMRRSAKILELEGCIGPEYIEKAIEHVEEYGDYIVVSPGIALAHANKDYGVYKDALSLLISRPGVIFSDGETVVHFLFCFASTGQKEYLELLQEVVNIGKEKGRLEKLLLMDIESIYGELVHTG